MEFLSKDIVYINSANRNSGTSNNFIIDISNQIKTSNNYDRISLLAFACPKSYYLINSKNNTFVVTETPGNTTITLPIGNYSYSTMLTQLNTSLASCNYTYVVTFDRLTAKYTFTVSGATGNPQFDFSNNNLGRILGFNKSVYTFSGGILNSANVVNFQLTSTVQLMCSLAERSLLATIIPDVSDLSIILYNEQNTQYVSKNVSSVNISSVRFWLLDATSSEELDLNGLEFTFKFVIYKENPYYRVMLNLLKIENAKKELEQKQ